MVACARMGWDRIVVWQAVYNALVLGYDAVESDPLWWDGPLVTRDSVREGRTEENKVDEEGENTITLPFSSHSWGINEQKVM